MLQNVEKRASRLFSTINNVLGGVTGADVHFSRCEFFAHHFCAKQ